MDRLTKRVYGGITRESEIMCSNFCTACGARNDCEHITACIDRLAAYEDTGYTPEELAGLVEKKKAGLLVELPCKVGDLMYSLRWSIMNNRYVVNVGTIVNVRYDTIDELVTVSDGERFYTWGTRAFATLEAAEAALAGKKGK